MKNGQIMWICENHKWGQFANWSLSYLRRECVAKMCDSKTLTWSEIKAGGWVPVKVKVTIEKIEK